MDEPKDTEWLRHVRIKSKLLSDFWGTPIYLGATALVPKDFDRHPQAKYPTLYAQSQERTGAVLLQSRSCQSRKVTLGLRAHNVQTGYEFYQSWTSEGFPRFVVIVMEQSSPYFLEAYSVDSANHGPYGKAITEELIPYLEKKFRLIPKSYARIVEGASTGGWESLALQLKYPDFFGGAWVFNPDPIDFTHYQHDEHLSGRECVLGADVILHVGGAADAANGGRAGDVTRSARSRGSKRYWAARAARAISSTAGKACTDRSARTVIR